MDESQPVALLTGIAPLCHRLGGGLLSGDAKQQSDCDSAESLIHFRVVRE